MNITAAAIEALRNHREDLDRAIQVLERVSHWESSEPITGDECAHPEHAEPSTIMSSPEKEAISGRGIQAAASSAHEEMANLPGWEACRLALRRDGEAMTVPQIVSALERHGFHLGSKDRRAYVSTTLRRHSDVFVRIGNPPPVRWGLHEWTERIMKR